MIQSDQALIQSLRQRKEVCLIKKGRRSDSNHSHALNSSLKQKQPPSTPISIRTSAMFHHVVLSGNNNTSVQFDLDDAITMPDNLSLMTPFLTPQFDLHQAITMPENPQSRARQQEVARLVSNMPSVVRAAGSCSVCMESLEKSEEAARQVSCGHLYHHNCIIGWLLNGNSDSCPLCRRGISG